MVDLALSPQSSIKALLNDHPALVEVFLAKQLGCIGCAMNKYCNLEDVIEMYDLPEDFIGTLENAISAAN